MEIDNEQAFEIPSFKTKVITSNNHKENGNGDHRNFRGRSSDNSVVITKMRLNNGGCTIRFFSSSGRCFEPTQLAFKPEWLTILAKLP